MRRAIVLAERNRKELLRDPLSYLFCLGFPLVMLGIMTLVNESIPEEAHNTVFQIGNLTPGIAVFGEAFLMLFTGLTVSRDRAGSFLVRLYATPADSRDFVLGYMVPMMEISAMQHGILYLASWGLSAVTGDPLDAGGMLVSILVLQVSAAMFIGIGLLLGTLFSEKTAPGLCSLIISLSTILGCIWFDAESVGGVMLQLCKLLPFFYCTKAGRAALRLDFGGDAFGIPLLVVFCCAAVVCAGATAVFRRRMKADLA